MEGKTNNTLQAFWVGMGSLSSFALGIISAAILSRYFDKEEYGTYRQILYVYNTLLIIFSAGLPRVFAYYLPKYPIQQGKYIVWKISKILFFFGLLFSIFLFVFSDFIAKILNNPELANGLRYFSFIPMLLLPTLGIEGIFSTYKKTIYIAIYNVVTRVLMLIFIVLPVIIFEGSYLYAIYGWILVSIISLIIAYFFKEIPFNGVKEEKAILPIKDVFSYSLPLVLSSIAGIAIKSADQFYISRYFGAEVFAEFANGFIELPLVGMITGATSVVLMPLFSKTFHEEGNVKGLIKTWKSALNKSALMIYPLVIFFMVFAIEVITLLYSEKYVMSAKYFQINMFVNFFNIIIFAPLFFSMGKTKLYSKVHFVLAIVIWVIDYFLIIIFNNPIAIAISSTSINVVKILFFVFLVTRILNVTFTDFFPIKSLLKLSIHSIIIVLFVKLVEDYYICVDSVFIKLLITMIIYSIMILITGPLIKIDYLSVIRPIIKKMRSKI